MGGLGYTNKGHGTSSNSKGRYSYGLMVIIAFGAVGIIGVMALHKFRERRIFNLLVKDKDRQLFSLQLLLQKERDYAKETERDTEEMKSKLYYLRSQKIDLDSRILEMQSTISSLKDEQKAMETALEEKQSEIQFLREKESDLSKESPQLTSLSEALRQKEAEIEDLKNRLGSPVKVWSVSTEDPSNPSVNLTLAGTDKNEVTKSEQKNVNYSTSKGDGSGSGSESTNDRDEEESPKLEISKEGSGNGSEKSGIDGKEKEFEVSKDWERLVIGKEERKENGTKVAEVQDHRDKDIEVKGVDSIENGVNYKGVVKFELPDQMEDGASYKLIGNPANTRKGKGKRWRVIAKKGNSKENGVVSVRGRKFFKDALESERKKRIENTEMQKMSKHEDRDMGLNARNESKEDGKISVANELQQMEHLESNNTNAEAENAQTVESTRNGEKGEENTLESLNAVVSTGVALQKGKSSKDGENMSEEVENGKKMEDDILQKRGKTEDGENASKEFEKGKGKETEIEVPYEKPRDFPGELPPNRTIDGEGQQKPGEVGINEEKVDNDSKQGKGADKHEETEDLEAEEVQEAQESDKDISREFKSKFEESKEDGEETEEPQF